jgi:hypothetical protein
LAILRADIVVAFPHPEGMIKQTLTHSPSLPAPPKRTNLGDEPILRYLHRASLRPDWSLPDARPTAWPSASESGPTARLVPCALVLLVWPWQYAFAAAEPLAGRGANQWFSTSAAVGWKTHQLIAQPSFAFFRSRWFCPFSCQD